MHKYDTDVLDFPMLKIYEQFWTLKGMSIGKLGCACKVTLQAVYLCSHERTVSKFEIFVFCICDERDGGKMS